jgi:hypothetical protein
MMNEGLWEFEEEEIRRKGNFIFEKRMILI